MTWIAWVGMAVLVAFLLILMVASLEEAVNRRRAWNLWIAGVIDDAELQRRVDH